jgi:hypothetical protein
MNSPNDESIFSQVFSFSEKQQHFIEAKGKSG